jgi:hypothetical protein
MWPKHGATSSSPSVELPPANLDQGHFTEGHELDRKWKVPQAMIGRRLTQAGATRLLAKLDEGP